MSIIKNTKYILFSLTYLLTSGCASMSGAGTSWDKSDACAYKDAINSECRIELGDVICVSGGGAWFENNVVSILDGGTYIFTGSTEDGCICVETDEPVRIVLDGVSISNIEGFAVLSESDELTIETRNQSDISGFGGDYGTAVYSCGRTFFTGKARIDISGGIYSKKEIMFKGVSSNLPVSTEDGAELIIGKLVID